MRTVCPYDDCSRPLEIIVRKPGGISKSTSMKGEWLDRVFRPRRYEQTVDRPSWGYTTQVLPVQAERKSTLPATEMQPGETRERQEYRPKSTADVMPGLLYSAVFGGAIGGVAIGLRSNPWTVIGVASAAFAFSFLVTSWPVVFTGGASVVSVLEKLTRTDINGDGRIGDLLVDLTADVPTGPQSTSKTKVTIPLSEVRAWRAFCQDVTNKECHFSGNAYEEHDGDRALFDRIAKEWAKEDLDLALVDPESIGERKTPRLTSLGEDTVAIHGITPLPQLLSLLERLTGTDRQ